MRFRSFTLFLVLFLLSYFSITAQTSTINYQGVIKINGVPVNGSYDVELGIYTAATGGTFLGSWANFNISVVNGVYSANYNFPQSLFSASPRYVDISVKPTNGGPWQTLSPRQLVTQVPYAVNSATLNGVGPSGFIQNASTLQSGANFNIGGNGTIGGVLRVGGEPGGLGGSFSSSGRFDIDAPFVSGGRFTVLENGNVGIGSTAPEQKLHVVGNEILSTGASSGFKFRDRGSESSADDWVWYSNGNIARFFRAGVGDVLSVQTNGNVGIGTNAPTTKLEVNGYTKLGSDAPSIKVKKLTGTTAASASCALINHGLDVTKILAVSVMVNSAGNRWHPPSYLLVNGYHFTWIIDTEGMQICNVENQSFNILSKPLKVLITYEQ